MKRSSNNIHTGKLIEKVIAKQRLANNHLGKRIDRSGSTVASYIKNDSIQTGILLDLCHALKYNFFKDIAAWLPEDFSHSVPKDNVLINQKDELISEREKHIAQLQEEVKSLTIENNIMKKALKIS